MKTKLSIFLLLALSALQFGCTTAINTEVSYIPETGEVTYRSEKDVLFERNADGSIRLEAVASAPELARTQREIAQQQTTQALVRALTERLPAVNNDE